MLDSKQALGTVLIMAGGTGGHIFPALSIARHLQSKGYRTEWLGTPRGLEVDVLRDTDIPLHLIDAQGLRGKGLLRVLSAPFMIASSVLQSLRVIRTVRPCCVLGMGGYVTGPGGVAAKLSGCKLLIHEQNAIAGFTNKLLARIADTVMEAFPATFSVRTGALLTGNPVRVEISALPLKQETEVKSALKILIIGGSLGAVAINDLIPQALLKFTAQERPQVWHQVGKNNVDSSAQRYRDAGITLDENCRVVPFIADMAAAYEWADLVLCRAGATTVSEVAAAGLPSILVPFPYAVDDHQTRNAQWLSDAEAAVLIQQSDLSAADLAGLWQQFQQDRSVLSKMAEKARALAHFNANDLVATQCMEACKG